MHIPVFSIFSAVSELFVTAGVVYIIRRNWTRRTFSLAVLLVVALFEACVNVAYMSRRAAQAAAPSPDLSQGMKIAFAAHGMLSLLAYIAFVILGVLAYQEQRKGRFLFRESPAITWVFLIGWTISVGSGEALFALRYLT